MVRVVWKLKESEEGLEPDLRQNDPSVLYASKHVVFYEDLVVMDDTVFCVAAEFSCLASLIILAPHTEQSECVFI